MGLNIFQNLDLLLVGVTVAAIGILGFVVFINNKKSITARSFLFFSGVTIFWSVLNYASYQIYEVKTAFWILRGVIFFAVWHAFSFFQLAYTFPASEVKFPKYYKYGVLPLVVFVSLLDLTPFVFESVAEVAPSGEIVKINNGPGIAVFGALVSILILSGIFLLLFKAFRAKGPEQEQLRFVLWGVFLTFALLLTFNFILPAFADSPEYIPLGSVFLLPFALSTFYAIFRYNLLNIKIISTEIVVFFLVVVTFSEILLSQNLTEVMFRSIVFIALLIISFLLIKSVVEEVKAREMLEKLDQAKSEFISLAGHQLRAPLTVIKGYTSMLMEGSFGVLTKQAEDAMDKVFVASNRLAKLVSELLDLSRIEAGRIKYEFKNLKLDGVIERVLAELATVSADKNIEIEFKNENKNKLGVSGDADKLHEVVLNLLDNALKYSAEGPIKVLLEPAGPPRWSSGEAGKAIRFSVKDRGLGIPQEEIKKLFVKFGRTEISKKERPDGMGLGLYFVKRIVDDHKGRVWVESEGIGKGSTFFVELPVA